MIKFFGCSYTEGGGLDNIDYYNFANNKNLEYWPKNITNKPEIHRNFIADYLENYKIENRFTTLIQKELNVPIKNLAVSQASNNYIFEKLFNEIEENSNETYVVVLSLFYRRYWFYEYDQMIHNLNNSDMTGLPFLNRKEYERLSKHFQEYLEIIFNEPVELVRTMKKVKLFDAFAKTKGSKIIWTAWEMGDYQTELEMLEKTAENIIKFDGLSMKHYCMKYGYQIHDETNGMVNDNHITIKGNQEIAKIFINYINENNLI